MAGWVGSLFGISLLLAARPLFAVELEVTPQQDVDDAAVLVGGYPRDVAIASDGADWLVVGRIVERLFGEFHSGGGTRRLPGRFEIAAPLESSVPAIEFDGDNYLVAWGERDASTEPMAIRVRTISSDGEMAAPVTVATLEGNQAVPQVFASSSGTALLIAWQEPTPERRTVRWVLVEGQSVLDAGTVALEDIVFDLALDFSHDEWLLVIATEVGLKGVRIGSDGAVLDTLPFLIDVTSSSEPSVAPADDGWAVAWRGPRDVRAAWVSRDAVATPVAEPLRTTDTGFPRQKLLRTDSGYALFAFEDQIAGDQVFLQPLLPDLSSVGLPINVDPDFYDAFGYTAAAVFGDTIFLSWASARGWWGRLVDAAGEPLDSAPFSILQRTNSQSSPDAAYQDGHWFVSWTDNRTADSGIYGKLLDHSGTPVGSPIRIHSGVPVGSARVAAGSDAWLSVWTDQRYNVMAKRIDAAVTSVDSEPIIVGQSFREPAVVFDGTNWAVAWENLDGFFDTGTAVIRRIASDGSFVDSVPIVLSPSNDVKPWTVGVAFEARTYRVSWSSLAGGLYEQRVDSSGRVLRASPIALTASGSLIARPALAVEAANAWLLWDDDTTSSLVFQTLGIEQEFQTFDAYSSWVDLVSVGGTALSVWTNRSGIMELGLASAAGHLENKSAFAQSASGTALEFDGRDAVLLTYAEDRDIEGYLATRVASRLVTIQRDEPEGAGGAGNVGGDSGTHGDAGDGGDTNAGGDRPDGGASGRGEAGTSDEPSGGEEQHASGGRSGFGGNTPVPNAGGAVIDGAAAGESSGREPGHGSRIIRTKGCGCRIGAADADDTSRALLALAAFALARMRRLTTKPRSLQ